MASRITSPQIISSGVPRPAQQRVATRHRDAPTLAPILERESQEISGYSSEPSLHTSPLESLPRRPRSASTSDLHSVSRIESHSDSTPVSNSRKCGFEKLIERYLHALDLNALSYRDAQEIDRIFQSIFNTFAELKNKDCTDLALRFEETGDCEIESTGLARSTRKWFTTGEKNELSGNDISDNLNILAKLATTYFSKTHSGRYHIGFRQELIDLYKNAKLGLKRLQEDHYKTESDKQKSITTFCQTLDQVFGLEEAPVASQAPLPSAEPVQVERKEKEMQVMKPFEDFQQSLFHTVEDAYISFRDNEVDWIRHVSFFLEASYKDLMTSDLRFLEKLSNIHSSLVNDPPSLPLACLLFVEQRNFRSNSNLYLDNLKKRLVGPGLGEEATRAVVDLRKRLFPQFVQESSEIKRIPIEAGLVQRVAGAFASIASIFGKR